MPRLTLCLLSLLVAIGLATNATAGTSKTVSTTHTVTPSDADLDATIRAKLAKSKIGKDGFKFHVQHGVVTWEGSTAVMQHKGSATRMAHSAGATKVVNNIQVSGGSKIGGPVKKAEVVQ